MKKSITATALLMLFAMAGFVQGAPPTTGPSEASLSGAVRPAAVPVITEGESVSVTMDEDGSPTAFTLTLHATDADGDPLTWGVSSGGVYGNPSVGSGTGFDQVISYVPASNFNGTDSFVVRVLDGVDGFDDITVNVTVNPRNDPPVNTAAPSVSGTPHVGQMLTGLSGTWNDSDDLNPGTITFTYQWQRADDEIGTNLTDIPGATASVYTVTVVDNLKYLRLAVTATDNGEGLPAAASTTVNTPWSPVANAAPGIVEGTMVSVTLDEDGSPTAFALTLHAADMDNDTLTWSISSPAAHGTASASGTGTSKIIGYTPDPDYNILGGGPESFVVQVTDGLGGTDTIIVDVTVMPRNDAPVNAAVPTVSGAPHFGEMVTGLPGTWNDDIDLVPGVITFTYRWQRADDAAGTNLTDIPGATAQTYTVVFADNLKYLRLAVTATDNGEGLPAAASTEAYSSWHPVTNVGPVITEGSSVAVTMDEDGAPTAFALTLHATDADADTLTWSVSSPAAHGTATASGTGESKVIDYAPTPDYNSVAGGAESFVIQVSDGLGGTDTVTVNVTVNQRNDAPVNIVPGAQAVDQDTDLVLSSGAGTLVAVADADVDETAMPGNTVRVTLAASHGTLTLARTTGMTFSSGDGTADASMVFTANLTNVNAAMDGMRYRGDSGYSGADTLSITTSDLGNTGAGGILTDADAVAITVRDTAGPTVTNVTASTANGSYRAGQLIQIQVSFSEAVDVTDFPRLFLETGASDGYADYVIGSGSSVLTFHYLVLSPHESADLDYRGTDALILNGGTIKDAAGNDAILTLSAPGTAGSLGANKDIVIDTAAPAVPNTPDLQAASDSGTSNTDNITEITTPTFDITGLESGATVILTITPIGGGEAIVVQALVAAGYSTSTITVPSPLSPGVYTVTARQEDPAGNASLASQAMAPSLHIAVAPSVSTQAATDVASTTATGNGTIVALGSPQPTAHGFVWNTTGAPTLADALTDAGAASATGPISGVLTGLSPDTYYFVRAYATNALTTVYGDQFTFTSLQAFTLAYAAGAGGTISGVTSQTVDYGGSGTPVTAVADENYHFVSWSDGVLTNTRTDANVTANISVTATFAPDSTPERSALIALYDATGGDSWTNNTGWKAAPLHTDGFAMPGTEGTWYGVSESGGHITALVLPGNNLQGSLPSSIGDLAHLSALNLGSNLLSGGIPSSIGNLTSLELLRLGNNQLTGQLPAGLWTLSSLVELDLSANQLSGSLPAEVGGLTVLRQLLLYSNAFSGSLPSEIGSLVNLRIIALAENDFEGPLPSTIGSLTLLEQLMLQGNRFSGELPESWGGLSSLTTLQVASNNLSGPIPPSFGNLANLTALIAGNNSLSGGIPTELAGLDRLVTLDLRFNSLTGTIPGELAGMPALQILYLQHNQLSGSIPAALGGMTGLKELMLHSNLLTGGIPEELGGLTNLEYLYLNINQLSGAIPASLGNLQHLTHLHLQSNQLSGTIPAALGGLPQIVDLCISDNSIEGAIPTEFGNLTQLQILNLYGNKLTGPIPTSLTNLTALLPGSTDLGYNALFTSDTALATFLSTKDPDWEATQTIAPAEVTATSLDSAVILVSWLPISYTGGLGSYGVWISETAGGTYTLAGQTADKSAASLQVTGLIPGTRYYFVVRTHTNAHSANRNALDSENSAEVSAFAWTQIDVQISGAVTLGGAPLAGVVMAGLPDGTVTGVDGTYSATVAASSTITVIPMLDGYSFSPVSRTYSGITENQTGQDYIATEGTTHTLTYTAGDNGSIDGITPQLVAHGGSGTAVTAVADTGYHFLSWSDGVLTASRTDTNVTADITVTANFAVNTYTLSVTSDHGTITKVPDLASYDHGATVQITAAPVAGYSFVNWTGDVTSTDNPLSVTMDGNKSLIANYSLNTYTLAVASDHGTITKVPDLASYDYGATVQLTATPATGYTFVNWTGDVTSTDNPLSVTMDGNKSLVANYSLNTYTLTYTAGAGGSITGDTPQTVNHGSDGTPVTAVPDTGYHFVDWSDGVLTATRTDTNVTANLSVTANFSVDYFALTITKAGTGDGTILSTPSGISCGSTCVGSFAYGTVVSLSAVPSSTSSFTGWDGDYTGTDNPLTVTMDGPKTLQGTFARITHTISGTVTAGGSPLPGVTMTGLPGSPVTDASGFYSATVDHLSACVVTPTHAFYSFDPTSRTYTNIESDFIGQDYDATLITTPQRQALIALYNSTNGDSWTDNSGWKTAPLYPDGFALPGTESTWHGLTVDPGTQLVTGITLSSNGLTGSLPSALGALSSLTTLNLDHNALTGPLPAELGNLVGLVRLHLAVNQFSGGIPPELGNLTGLQYLNLGTNQLTGSIPSQLGNLTGLETLNLYDNQLTGTIPPELGNLTALTSEFALGDNQLTGPIPPEFGNLVNLRTLWLNDNRLGGPIPASLGNLVNLEWLMLKGNQLAGPIPATLTALTALNSSHVDLGYNALYTTDEALITFMNSKDADWTATQTIAPTSVTATSLDNAVIMVSWLPIAYTADAGHYNVLIAETAGGPYTPAGQTADKTTSSVNVTGLTPGTRYYFVVRTVTDAHANNANIVESGNSSEATAMAWTQLSVTISGHVTAGGSPLAGVVLSGLPEGTVTDATGAYSATVAVDFSGAVTPVLAGYTFTPASRTYSNLTADQTAQDYAATLLTYAISGTVTAGGTGLSGVTMAGLPGSPVTDAAGFYSATVDYGSTLTVTPTHSHYSFDPASNTYTNVTANITGQDYAATLVTTPQRQALIALYNSTNGDSWTNNSGWKTAPLYPDGFALPGTEGTWYGITVDGSQQVTEISLLNNNLTGSIPAEIGNLTELQFFFITGNQLSGSIPATIGNLTKLLRIHGNGNLLSGSIPAEIGGLTLMEYLDLRDNRLTGEIPASLGNLTILSDLYLSGNQLSGPIPAELGGMTRLRRLVLDTNQLTGSIPSSLGGLADLETLSLSGNQLSGSIPSELGSLTHLRYLWLQSNQLSGSIPGSLGSLPALGNVDLSQNQLTGTLPDELANATGIFHLALASNMLEGPIPGWIGSLAEITNLDLSRNRFSGPIPAELGSLVHIQRLGLNGNRLEGPIPASLMNLANLFSSYTDFGYNALYTSDETLIAFLNSKDTDWAATQTIAPTEVTATSLDNATILVSWLPVTYTADAGRYNVLISETAGGPYTPAGQTAGKADTSLSVSGLTPGTRYYFVVRTVTDAHANNANIVESGNSSEATAMAWTQLSVAVSGHVTDGGSPLAGVVLSGLPEGTVTDATGAYSATVAVDFSGTVTPVLAGYSFTPVSRTYANLTADQTAQDYAATLLTCTISGTVTTSGSPLAGVAIAGLPGSPVTDAAGYYSASVIHGWSGTATPTHAGYTFEPASRSYSTVTGNQPGQDYLATAIAVPTLTVTSPNGGETWAAGSAHAVTWTPADMTGTVTIDLYKGGVFQKTLGTAEAMSGTFSWHLDAAETTGTDYTVLVWQEGTASDDSDAAFAVVPAVKVDFNRDGQEDILWRYYGTGDYQGLNVVWLMHQTETGEPLAMAAASSDVGAASLLKGTSPGRPATTSPVMGSDWAGFTRPQNDFRTILEGAERPSLRRDRIRRDPADIDQALTPAEGRQIVSPGLLSVPARRDAVDLKVSAPDTMELAAFQLNTEIVFSQIPDTGWEIAGTGDFNGDGHTDILWRYYGTGPYQGLNDIWFMNGTTFVSESVFSQVPDTNWRIAGTGDFDRDGHTDILWRYYGTGDYQGLNVIWYMNGTSFVSETVFSQVTDTAWKIAGTGDFDGDEDLDILWRYQGPGDYQGLNVIWYMNGVQVLGETVFSQITDIDWQICGTGDFNNDGQTDILWRYYGIGPYQGLNDIWYMNGTSFVSEEVFSAIPDTNWKIVNR